MTSNFLSSCLFIYWQIRLFNFGGDIFGDPRASHSFFHFVGVLVKDVTGKKWQKQIIFFFPTQLYSSDRQ